MLTEAEVKSIFERTGALLQGHFQLTSGRHGDQYFQCALVLQHPKYTEMLCRELAARFSGEVINTIVHELRHHLESLAGVDDLVREEMAEIEAYCKTD
jgi:hypothetical protein